MEKLRESWEMAYAEFWSGFAQCFVTKKSFKRAQSYVRGLMGGIERKNGWQLAEFTGDVDPYAIQNFLYRATWDVGMMRDKLSVAARETLLCDDEKGVLIIDETGFLKQGDCSAGVKRQYSGTAGRIENSQVGVFLGLAGSKGRVLIDRELYLPEKEWCEKLERRASAGIPEEIKFKTKPQMAIAMLERAFSAGYNPEWVLADAAYGNDSKFRNFLEERQQAYVVGISKSQRIWIDYKQVKVEEFVNSLPRESWKALSVGAGSKGERIHEWIGRKLEYSTAQGMKRYVLARRKGEEITYYFCYADDNASLDNLAVGAGKRWNIECCFETAKQETGLDEYEVRTWQGWYRHITLSMIALLLLEIFKGLGKQSFGEKKAEMRPFKFARNQKNN